MLAFRWCLHSVYTYFIQQLWAALKSVWVYAMCLRFQATHDYKVSSCAGTSNERKKMRRTVMKQQTIRTTRGENSMDYKYKNDYTLHIGLDGVNAPSRMT